MTALRKLRQSGGYSPTTQAIPRQEPAGPFGGCPFPLPVFLPVSEGTDDVRASIMLCSIKLSIRSCTQNVNNF